MNAIDMDFSGFVSTPVWRSAVRGVKPGAAAHPQPKMTRCNNSLLRRLWNAFLL
ncbi:hypothetical protein [Mesorhizobium sp. J428]|uniref:hypothetical protein n=1 Tax=Mesorhizobium sp. J428 TaxID=2898440 RepID=UPI002151E1D2|nr:hypothetical protein [Mesorhizobium sp. J428]MCR5859110.1 hypothetical protein [Mesorhizobium sp. J428]